MTLITWDSYDNFSLLLGVKVFRQMWGGRLFTRLPVSLLVFSLRRDHLSAGVPPVGRILAVASNSEVLSDSDHRRHLTTTDPGPSTYTRKFPCCFRKNIYICCGHILIVYLTWGHCFVFSGKVKLCNAKKADRITTVRVPCLTAMPLELSKNDSREGGRQWTVYLNR